MAEFYLHHRLSEDIDLFCEDEEVDQRLIETFLVKVKKTLKLAEIRHTHFLGLFTYNLVYKDKQELKVDFNYYPFGRINKGNKYKNIELDSELDIAVNKVHTIAMKPRARDFIDIYFLVKEKGFRFDDLLSQAKIKFDWHIDRVTLGSQLLKALDVSDYPKMIKKINHQEWKDFFVNEAKKLGKKIFK